MRCTSLVLAAFIAPAGALRRQRHKVVSTEVVGLEINEHLQKNPVDIGHEQPTGVMTVDEAEALNLKVWARIAEASAIEVVERSTDPASQVDDISYSTKKHIDEGLSVHVCLLDASGSCDITMEASQSTNRYLDMHVLYKGGGLRFLFVEDAAKAVAWPESFNIVVSNLQLAGSAVSASFVGKNLDIQAAGQAIDAEGLAFVNSKLIRSLAKTTSDWEWKCTQRASTSDAGDVSSLAAVSENAEAFTGSFPGAIYNVINDFLSTVPGEWSVSFGSPVTKTDGIQFSMEYGLCAHLMGIPATIQSSA